MTRLQRLFLVAMVASAILAALASGILAQEPSAAEMMDSANRQYERGEYAEAVQQYEALVALGYRDTALHYNLGNAYLQRGDLGRSILNYLRAEELSPRDPDIVANLELARSRTVDQLQVEGDSLVASVSDFGRRWATAGEFGIAALLLWAITGIAVAAVILRPAIRGRAVLRGGAAVSFVAMLAALALLLSILHSNPYESTGVVTAGTVEALSGPGPQFAGEFTLHSGAQVRLVDSRHGWLQVALPGGELQGWLPAHTIEAVGPDGGI